MNDRLTLVVFKDHLSSRTLTVRLAWLRAFGLALLSVISLTIIAGALFLNAYRKTISSGSLGIARKTEEIEKELAEIKASYEILKKQAIQEASGGRVLGGAANSFASLPPDAILESLPTRESLAFRLEALKASWKGNTLQIRSAIEYTREDGGNQQGHFILIARGPQSLLAYPEGTFSPGGTATLMRPESGEYFSVSRYREIRADFGPFAKRDDAQNIEIYIFDTRKRLIYFDRIGIESNGSTPPETTAPSTPKAKPKPAIPKAAPTAEETPSAAEATVSTPSSPGEEKPAE